MSTTRLSMSSRRDDKTMRVLGICLVASIALHGSGLFWANLQKMARKELAKPIVVEFIQVEPPKPPEPPPPEPEKPKPVEPPKPKVVPVKLAVVKPPPEEPPPPLEEIKEPPKVPPPLFVGVKMSSTTAAGTFAAPVGNTAYGQMPKAAPNPAEVRPYNAPKYVPPGSADRDPEVADEFKIPYPDEARKAGVEGTVRLRIVVDNEGRVVDVKVLNGPGYGLNDAARDAIRRFKFKAAIKGGEPVSTTMVYNYTFLLD
ncbi:MAG: ferric siderophore transporter, periplasmic energy transduction protein TonB [Myxococcaceae bacterium]|nr:ferric siderophore transporter, periplasmic energy transduction protein TonB [Myxococcaceae bacterium]